MQLYYFPSFGQAHKNRIFQFALRNCIKHSQLFDGVALEVTPVSKTYISKQLRLNRIEISEFIILAGDTYYIKGSK